MVDVPFRPMNDHFVTILVFFAVFSAKKVGILDLFWLAACRRRFFFGPNSVSLGKGPEEHCLEESLQSVMWWDLTFGLLSLEEKEEAKKNGETEHLCQPHASSMGSRA